MDRAQVWAEQHGLLLVLVVCALGLLLRALHTGYGLPYLYHTDEPQIASTALQMMRSGDLNPQFFHYGSLLIYLNLAVDVLHYLYLMGQPETAAAFLTSLDDLSINHDTGWHWSISHPSFYQWNRMLTAAFGTLTILVTYLMARRVFNVWVGLAAALVLALLPYHIEQSAWISTDVPATFFVTTSVLLSVLFLQEGRTGFLVWAFVCAGLAAATKYNAGLVIVAPALALLVTASRDGQGRHGHLWILLPIVPLVTVLAVMPFALVDLRQFLDHLGWEVRHYKVIGHPGNESAPGLEHMMYQLRLFVANLGVVAAAAVLIGALAVFSRPLLAFTLVVPVLFVLYMTQMTTNFHRNFLPVYPFLALLAAASTQVLHDGLRRVWRSVRLRYLPATVGSGALVLILIPIAVSSIPIALQVSVHRDTRSLMVDVVNELVPAEVLVAEELRVHELDLARLVAPYRLLSVPAMRVEQQEGQVHVYPAQIASHTPEYRELAGVLQARIDTLPVEYVVSRLGAARPTRIDRYSVDPAILIWRFRPPRIEELAPLEPAEAVGHETTRMLFSGWSAAEDTHRWSDGTTAAIRFNAAIDTFAYAGELHLRFFTRGRQSVAIVLNDELLFQGALDSRDGRMRFDFPPDLLRGSNNVLSFELPDARSPRPGDQRLLAFALVELSVH